MQTSLRKVNWLLRIVERMEGRHILTQDVHASTVFLCTPSRRAWLERLWYWIW